MTTQPPETESSCSEIMALLLEIQKETKGLQSEMFKVRGIADEALDIAEKAAGRGKDELDKKKVIQWVKEALSGNGPLALAVVGMFGYASTVGTTGARGARERLEQVYKVGVNTQVMSQKTMQSMLAVKSAQERQERLIREAQANSATAKSKAVQVEKTLNRDIPQLRRDVRNASIDRNKLNALQADFNKKRQESLRFNQQLQQIRGESKKTTSSLSSLRTEQTRMGSRIRANSDGISGIRTQSRQMQRQLREQVDRVKAQVQSASKATGIAQRAETQAKAAKKTADGLNRNVTNLTNTVKTTTAKVNNAVKEIPAIKRTVGVLQKDIKDFLPFKRQLGQLGDLIKNQPAIKKLVAVSKPLTDLAAKASGILKVVGFADRVLSEFINKKTFDVMSRRIDTLEKANAMQDKSFTQIFNQLTLIKGGGGSPAIKLTQIIPRFVNVERTIKSVEVKVESTKKEVKQVSDTAKRDIASTKKEIDTAKKQASEATKKADQANKEALTVKSAFDALKRAHESYKSEVSRRQDQFKSDLSKATSEITKLFSEAKRLSSENKTQGDYIRDLQSQVKAIPGLIDRKVSDFSKSFESKLSQLRGELDRRVKEAQARFDGGLQAAQAKINEILGQIKAMLTLQQLRQELSAQNAITQGMINNQSSLIQTMINQLLGFIRAEIKETNQSIGALGSRLSSLNSQIAGIPASMDAKFNEVRQHVSNQSASVTNQVNQTIVNVQSNLGNLVQSVNTNLLNVQTNLSRQVAGIPSAVQSVVQTGIAQVNASVQNTNISLQQFARDTKAQVDLVKSDVGRALTEVLGIKSRQDLTASVVYDINKDLNTVEQQGYKTDSRLSAIESKLDTTSANAKSASDASKSTEKAVKQDGVKLDNSTMGAIEQMIRFIMPGIVLAGVTAGLAGVFQLLNSIKADTAKTAVNVSNPGNCRFTESSQADIIRRIGEPGPIPNGLSGALVTNPDSVKNAIGKPIRGLFGQPIGVTTRVNSIFNTLGLVHIFNAIGMAMTIHNGIMLSVDIKETAIDLISTVVDIAREALSLKDPDDSAIDFNDIINKNFEALMDRLLGAEKWEETKIKLAAANRIYQAQANALGAINNAFNSLFDSVGIIGTYTGKIGNGLKAAAVVPQNAYDWMDEKVFTTLSYTGKISTFNSTLQNVQDAFEVMTAVATSVKEVQNGAKEIADAQKELLEARAEAALKFQQAEFIGRKRSFPDSDFAEVQLKTFGDDDDESNP